jgi:hypothetical protein
VNVQARTYGLKGLKMYHSYLVASMHTKNLFLMAVSFEGKTLCLTLE